jgi:MoCo/4Fe-4S cofactor protein with predicted Tat translocation signal
MSNKIWQSFGERNQTEQHNLTVQDEFKEDLPFEAGGSLLDAKAPRRDFLKYLGFSTAAATIAASCETPVKKAIPFVNRPENIVPGVADYYATTFIQDGDVQSVIAKVRDGRPIKIEVNDLSPITQCGTSARVQASVLDLYDTARIKYPAQVKEGKLSEISTFEAFDKQIASELASLGGKSVVLLSGTITSPSSKQLISQFLAKYPGSTHVQYDAVSYSGMILANEASYGKKAIPSYHFDNAKVIVSLSADFLGTWLSPVEFSAQFAKGRKIDEKNPVMSRHYQFESILSMTGANADLRFTHRPSESGKVALALYSAITTGTASGITDTKLKAGIEKAAAELKANAGAGLVVSGSNDTNEQIIVNAINEAIGSNGKTINWAVNSNYRQGVDSEVEKLVADMNAGAIGALFILDSNPLYTYHSADKFKSGLAKVKLSVSFNTRLDETTTLCKYVIPDHHYLESWGDAEPKTAYFSFIQPTIYPLFKTRQWQDSLLKWSNGSTASVAVSDTSKTAVATPVGTTNDYLTYLKTYWLQKLGSVAAWDEALRKGVLNPETYSYATASFNAAALQSASAAVSAAPVSKSPYELVVYQKVSIGTGSQAGNPWLQEMPDPVSKATWDNYVTVSAATAKELLGIDLTKNGQVDDYEAHPAKPVVKVTVGGKSIELPIIITPGTQVNTLGIAVGYGRIDSVGTAVIGAGKNAYPFTALKGSAVSYFADASLENAKYTYDIAQTQTHSTYKDSLNYSRVEVVKESTLATFKKYPTIFSAERKHLEEEYSTTGDYRNEGSLYDPRLNDRPGIHWGMSVDLNSCNGCNACLVACNAENNIPVVGKTEVLRGHDMHWIRIDRYFVSDDKNPDDLSSVVFMPMMCQHCDSAPCENVCPVAATNHSSEGLNQMTYNRCIGTRYCANNCPFKVRRFNWADYTGADSFPDNQVGHISAITLEMNDDLTRMVLNPDVTVRSRGVIEKCSFCVQRLQDGKLKAKKENRPLVDADVTTACQAACASGCITFGNANDHNSLVSQARNNNPNRMYYALDMLHVLPNVNYMAKLRNTDEILAVHEAPAKEHEGAEHHG